MRVIGKRTIISRCCRKHSQSYRKTCKALHSKEVSSQRCEDVILPLHFQPISDHQNLCLYLTSPKRRVKIGKRRRWMMFVSGIEMFDGIVCLYSHRQPRNVPVECVNETHKLSKILILI